MQRETPQVLFCLPYAGGGASIFSGWQKKIGMAIEVRALQLPGREDQFLTQPLDDMSRLVEHLLPTVLACDKPFAFFGHSFGALISYELCRRLAGLGIVPHALIVSARRPPHESKGFCLHDLSDERLKARLRDFGGTPERVLENDALMQMILPVLRADLRAAETYQPPESKPLACPIVACGALDDPLAPADDLHAWQRYTSASFRMAAFTGGHFFLRAEQDSLMAVVREALVGQAVSTHDMQPG